MTGATIGGTAAAACLLASIGFRLCAGLLAQSPWLGCRRRPAVSLARIVHSTPGMHVVAISNRCVERAVSVFKYAGLNDITIAESQRQLDVAASSSKPAATDDAMLLARCERIDVLVDVTGSVGFGARVALEAFKHGKHVVVMNAELDATIGPILQTYADRYGVILTACEGDEPGLQVNLYRWVKGLGLTPRVLGNVKGLQDAYRNPTTMWSERR
jgi:predicted homoserine dehydrogenase-like protein